MAAPVLIAEDDPNTACPSRTYLEREGFATVIASDGRQALTMTEGQTPLFVDMMLTEINGWDVDADRGPPPRCRC